MNKKALAQQLMIIQTATQAALDLLLDGEDPMCEHKNKDDRSTMGCEHWICNDCGYEFREDDK